MAQKPPFHVHLADKLLNLMQLGSLSKQNQITPSQAGYTVGGITRSFRLHQEITIMDRSLYDGLSIGAIKLVLRIQQELELNNPLWECSQPKSDVRRHLAELKRNDIIESIPGTDMYIVNPAKIRRGHPLITLGALYEYCKRQYAADKHWKISNVDIRALRSSGATLKLPPPDLEEQDNEY